MVSFFRKLELHSLIHMDYIYNIFMNFLKHNSLGGMDFQ